MKPLEIIRIAAIFACVIFISCSKDESLQYELVTGEKKVTKLEINNSELGYSVWNFNYDNEGKLLEVTYNSNTEMRKYDYVWKNSAINSSYQTYSLSDGLIRNFANYRDVRYDEERPQEIKYLSSYGDDYSFNWYSNGGLQSRAIYYKMQNEGGSQGYITELFKFIYDGDVITAKTSGFNPVVSYMLSWGFDGDPLCIAHPELVGGRTNVLPTHFSRTCYWFDINNRHVSETIYGACSYMFDKDGYVTEFIIREDDGGEYAFEEKYTIVWE